jgi:parallel beta-helix repeat protein
MKRPSSTFKRIRVALPLMMLMATLGVGAWGTTDVSANHPVLVEGTCLGPGAAQRTVVPVGTCGDYDGDGRIGVAEDTDEADRVFGTINAALGAANGGANQNGRVTIVASGVFPEVVNITAANGNVTLEAAPGVDANIDAVLAGDATGNTARQNAPGIIVNAPADRFVTIRNIVSRNWTEGIRVAGSSNVLIDSCRIENNTNYGIRVQGSAKVKINDTQVSATGFRVGGGMDFPRVLTPNPGNGIEYEDDSSGLICDTCVTGSFGAGIENSTRDNGRGYGNSSVQLQNVCVFNNNPDFKGIRGSKSGR